MIERQYLKKFNKQAHGRQNAHAPIIRQHNPNGHSCNVIFLVFFGQKMSGMFCSRFGLELRVYRPNLAS